MQVEAILQVELEAFPEPKALFPSDLRYLADKLGGYAQAARWIGTSEAFVRQNVQKR